MSDLFLDMHQASSYSYSTISWHVVWSIRLHAFEYKFSSVPRSPLYLNIMTNLTIEQLGLAYRKAKVDLYYSTNPNLDAISDYEGNLVDKLTALFARIVSDEEDWVTAKDFLGGWTVATKSITPLKTQNLGVIYSSPDAEWEQICNSGLEGGKPTAEFRLMADVSLDFHVLSSLWMLEVGEIFDRKLGKSAYGNRLRRTKEERINPYALGSFTPYLAPFRRWRDGGIETMRDALKAGKKVVALTADVSSFYHELNPGFMLDEKFKTLLGIELTKEQEKLHRLFIRALEAWSASTPLKKGLPVGLPASAVVANIALYELDQSIAREVMPLYYGRYVDDIILVMENGAQFNTTRELWEWLFVRVKNLGWADEEKKDKIKFSPPYLVDSKIRFGNDKNKVFLLTGESGQILVDSIIHQIQERASEWRALPNLPMDAHHVGTDLVRATQDDGDMVDNLRKTDSLTMRRSSFAMKLRDFEAYERDLAPDSWRQHRHAFLRAFTQHVIVLPHFFTLSTYLPRVIKLATACEDYSHLLAMVKRVKKLAGDVAEKCGIQIKSCVTDEISAEEITGRWRQALYKSIEESIVSAFPPQLTKEGRQAWLDVNASIAEALNSTLLQSLAEVRKRHARLFSNDLAHMPFRFVGLPEEMVSQNGIPKKNTILELGIECLLLLPKDITEGVGQLAHVMGLQGKYPNALLFPVRPFALAELCLILAEPFSPAQFSNLRALVLVSRGFTLDKKMPQLDKFGVLQIPDENVSTKQKIAVSSWSTRLESWVAAVVQNPDPDIERYARLAQLANSVMSASKQARYFILPELAIPAKWFMRLSQKLRRRHISLITGVEYLHGNRSRVRNQIWSSFSHNGLGFPSTIIYRQDKQKPALHEEQELTRLNNLSMRPAKVWKTPPIIQHGDFRFSMVVCSELTNISYRNHLRGKIDALFVPEWNQDTESFNALVESSALDIHAYIIQCNDRRYGDSRIRAPFKDSWKRDILRVKGGTEDYAVCGEIDIEALRRFQSSYRSPSSPFKPVPDGFMMCNTRKTLPD